MSQSSSNAVVSKVRALYGKRITKEQYLDMVNCRTVPEIAAYLKNNAQAYHEVLENIPESHIHRGQLESLLKRAAFNSYNKIYHYINTAAQNIFHYIILELELDQILQMVHLLKAGCPEKFILHLPGYLVSITDVDLMALAHVKNFDELLRILSQSHFGDILKQFKPTAENPSIDYVACEHALYEYHFRRMFQMIDKNTRGVERQELKRLFGTRIDQINLRNIYRSKAHFHTDAKVVAQLIFPFYYRVQPRHIDQLINAGSYEQLAKLLAEHFPASGKVPKLESVNDTSIELIVETLQMYACSRYLHLSSYDSVVFYSYYILSKIELNNLIHIIEGIRYNVPKEEIKELLVI